METPETRGVISGLILAGGKAERLGGEKALRLLRGKSLIERVYERLSAQVGGLAVAEGPSPLAWRGELAHLDDGPFSGKGPLAGIRAGLAWAKKEGGEWLVTAPCDVPFLPCDLVERLRTAGKGTCPVVVRLDGRDQNLLALWHVSHFETLDRLLHAGRQAVWEALKDLDAVPVDVPGEEADAFLNVNDAAAWAKADAYLDRPPCK